MELLEHFHPTVQKWFATRLGEPTPPQRDGWPAIRAGRHTLIAAPTGSGKTLAAFLSAIDSLIRQGPELPDATQVVTLKANGFTNFYAAAKNAAHIVRNYSQSSGPAVP